MINKRTLGLMILCILLTSSMGAIATGAKKPEWAELKSNENSDNKKDKSSKDNGKPDKNSEDTTNTPPKVIEEYPLGGAVDVSIVLSELNFKLYDIDGDPLGYYVSTDPGIGTGSDTDVLNGSYTVPVKGLSYDTTYIWWVNVTDGQDWTNASFTFTTVAEPYVNTDPTVTGPSPSDGASDVSIGLGELGFTLNDTDDDPMNFYVSSTPDIISGTQTGTGVLNGSYTASVSGLAYNTTYTWWVNATDGQDWTNTSYSFRTEVEPAINTPPTIIDISPSNGATGLSISLKWLNFTVGDPDNDQMNYTVTTIPDIGTGINTNVLNGSYAVPVTGLEYNTTYTWQLNLTDGKEWTNFTFGFSTEAISEPVPTPTGLRVGVTYYGKYQNWYGIPDEVLERDFNRFKNDGIDLIILPTFWNVLESSEGYYNKDVVNRLNHINSVASQYGVGVIHNIHTWYTGSNVPSYVGNQRYTMTDPDLKESWLNFVEYYITALDDPNVEGFQVFNELSHHSWSMDVTDDQFYQFCLDTYNRAKKVTSKPISARWGADGTYGMDERIYGVFDYFCVNYYDRYNEPSQLEDIIAKAEKYSKLVWITEFGLATQDDQTQSDRYRSNLELFTYLDVDTAISWWWSGLEGLGETSYNIADGNGYPREAYHTMIEYDKR